jgi:drug/metabolite transporter (DMT)-like permease
MTRNTKGAALMLLSCAIISVTDAISKIVLARIPVGQAILVRGLFLFLILFLFVIVGRRFEILRWNKVGPRFVCGLFQILAAWCFFTGLPYLPFSVAITAAYTSPLFLVLLSSWLLSERVGPIRAAAIVIGFLGIALISSPGSGTFSWAILLPVGSAFFGALRDVWLRKLTRSDSSLAILAYSQLLLTFTGIPSAIFEGVSLSGSELTMLAMMAIGMGLSVFCSIEAFRHSEASFVAPFKYSGMVWAPLLAFPIWNEIPSANQIVGMFLVGLGGILALVRSGTMSVTPIDN